MFGGIVIPLLGAIAIGLVILGGLVHADRNYYKREL
jgi:hypothetical protein